MANLGSLPAAVKTLSGAGRDLLQVRNDVIDLCRSLPREAQDDARSIITRLGTCVVDVSMAATSVSLAVESIVAAVDGKP